MKYLLLTISLIASFPFLAIEANAARPCKAIAEACFSAGVIQRGASRDAILQNCVQPVVAGKNIPGVNVDVSVIKACKEKIATQ